MKVIKRKGRPVIEDDDDEEEQEKTQEVKDVDDSFEAGSDNEAEEGDQEEEETQKVRYLSLQKIIIDILFIAVSPLLLGLGFQDREFGCGYGLRFMCFNTWNNSTIQKKLAKKFRLCHLTMLLFQSAVVNGSIPQEWNWPKPMRCADVCPQWASTCFELCYFSFPL